MAADVVDDRLGGGGVGELGVVAFGVVDLWVCGGGHDADLDGLFESGLSGGEAGVLGGGVVALDGVAEVVAEDGYAVHLADVLFEGSALGCEGRVAGGPAFAVDDDVGVDGAEGVGDAVHGLGVVDGHEVESEAVDVVLAGPVGHGVDDVVAHLSAFGGCLVAAAGGVGVAAVVVAGGGELEV